MAVGSGSVSNRSASKKKEKVKSSANKETKLPENENGVLSSNGKRSRKSAEIRVVDGRIHDSVNGKRCHQCRKKTMDFVATCKNQKNNKPCTITFCHKCLLNRYGEKAEEVSTLEDWCCPKCRDICICSICTKKRGLQPTSPGKRGKENSFDGKVDMNLPNPAERKSKKVKVQKGNIGNNTSDKKSCITDNKIGTKETGSEKQLKKKKRDRSHETNTESNDKEIRNDKVEKKRKKSRKDKLGNDDGTLARKTNLLMLNQVKNPAVPSENGKGNGENGRTGNMMMVKKHQAANSHAEIPLPIGIELNSVGGVDICAENVGNALQFLEFCAVFGKVLNVKKGQPEYVLQDLFHGRTGRRGKFSLTVQFYINLLSIILSEEGEGYPKLSPSHGKDSWFSALKGYVSESQNVIKAQGLDCLDKAADYDTLKASEKLRLLNFLCDELLKTEKVRNWMDGRNAKHAEKIKDAKQKLTAARDEEKCLKQKMKDDMAKAIIDRQGAPLSVSEHDVIISDIKQKTAEAHAKVLESKGMLLKNDQHSNVVRTEPVFVGIGGDSYWKLNCMGKAEVLRQNAGKRDILSMGDKWFVMDDEGKEAIEKLVCSSR